ncbi:glycosyltransferase 87 family protein [Mycobacterium sp.]|uniref:glycosyltransferase 87 family protein n=1 Tax=Mycobacterium sp. TaxID=1785 RepID=UPI002D319B6A|nr:glycosyltransferase 87 family protein [Mycobacterium sp.]HZA12160.1 glycosyltransferase 87 family protein [Mycobacterium sp.]
MLAAALLLYLLMYLRWPAFFFQPDVLVYRFGAQRVLDGADPYSIGLTGNPRELLFIYSPFAALCFVPLTLLDQVSVEVASLSAMFALASYAVWRMLKASGAAPGLWSLTALLVGVSAWLEPVRLSVQLGQINVAILAIVVADLLSPKHCKWAGVGIGLVAGIKLTPALFILYLLVIGRLRAAVLATGTLVGTVLIGFAVLPSASRYYWFSNAFGDINRISRDPFANTSVRGLVLRLHWPLVLATVLAVVLVSVSLVLAAIAYRRGHAVLAIAVVGMASAAASPFSWSHHWVWFVPLIVHLGYRAYVLGRARSALAMWMLCAVLASWFISFAGPSPSAGVLSLPAGGVWKDLLPGIYVFAFLAVLVCTGVWLWRLPVGPITAPQSRNAFSDIPTAV